MLDFFKRWTDYFIDQLIESLARNDRITVTNFGSIPRDLLLSDGPVASTRGGLNRERINLHNGQHSIFAPIRVNQENNAIEVISLSSSALSQFIEFHRQTKETNQVLSQQYNALDCKLMCPILRDFPLIPVRFNGRLYDYAQLTKLIDRENNITDPFTREKIKLSPHVIQPDYDAQERMDILLNEMKRNLCHYEK